MVEKFLKVFIYAVIYTSKLLPISLQFKITPQTGLIQTRHTTNWQIAKILMQITNDMLKHDIVT